ncbi:F0F1 ATP synthase subunit gamma, partial [Mycoplasma nasistruthionis]|uniref:F0F1 ATP synthase subunit gamma n=1 Tax=Mycoplasma nasistruthionis TaxID=353852 RepID=UPI0021CAE8AE
MANLNNLKNRIGVVANTQKITNAMQLVSTAKTKKLKKEFEATSLYLKLIQETFDDLVAHVQIQDFYNIFPKNKDVETNLHIVITSDLGLCGSYNHNIIKLFKSQFKPNDKVIVIGTKGYTMLKSLYDESILQNFTDLGDKINYQVGSIIAKKALELYEDKEVSSIYLYFTKFVNNVVQEAQQITLFPFDIEKRNIEASKQELEFEPNAETVLKNSIPLYISSMVYCLANESKISE